MKVSQGRWKRLDRLFEFAVVTAAAGIAILLAVAQGRFQWAFGRDSLEMAPYPQLSIVLLIVTCIYIALWYFAVSGEMELLRQYGEEFVPPLPDLKVYAFGLAVLLALLVYFSDNSLVYSALFGSQKFLEVSGIRIRDSKLNEGLIAARQRASAGDKRRAAWSVIEDYYLHRPQIPLAVIVLCFALAALVLSACGESTLDERPFFSAAFAILVSAIVLNEATYFLWRRRRDGALGERY